MKGVLHCYLEGYADILYVFLILCGVAVAPILTEQKYDKEAHCAGQNNMCEGNSVHQLFCRKKEKDQYKLNLYYSKMCLNKYGKKNSVFQKRA